MSENDFDMVPIPTDVTTSARAYGWMLGGKDNYEIDRQAVLHMVQGFPQVVDIARQNRQFLYRAVRFLAEEAGITQFIDLGCGLPTDNNVHQVAQKFIPDARVAYVDIDPIVLVHGRALLADNKTTTMITADMRNPQGVLHDDEVQRLIDFDKPLAVLFLSVVHHLVDDDDPRSVLRTILDEAVPGSYIAASQVVSDDPAVGAVMTEQFQQMHVPWQTRTPAEFATFFDGLEPVEPGLVNLLDWRPDPDQPALSAVDSKLRPYLGITEQNKGVYEYGGVLRKP